MTDPDRTPVVVAARRTPIGTAGHGLATVEVSGLLAPVLAVVVADLALLTDGAVGPASIGEVVVGNCMGPGGNPARVAALAAGLGVAVPALTVDRQCGSGQEAVHLAAAMVASGRADVVLAGGVESASTAPWRAWRPLTPGDQPSRYERAPFAPPEIGDPDMGPAAETVARRCGVGRERQDAYAARSHALALASAASGVFDAEMVPVAGVLRDERPRPLTAATLARLRPAFDASGTVTAGNSCGVSDGAAVVAVVSEGIRRRHGIPGLAVRDWVSAGVDPNTPGLGPVPATRRLLARAGLDVADLDVLEMTEAFAAQLLACADALGVDPHADDRPAVCPQGGAIALGHPWGASGTLLVVRLFAELVRADGPARRGVATCAVGGGQGLALLVEGVGG